MTLTCRPHKFSRRNASPMAMRTSTLSEPTLSCASGLIVDTFGALPDGRSPSNATKFVMSDAALSAFAVFFTQSPSCLD